MEQRAPWELIPHSSCQTISFLEEHPQEKDLKPGAQWSQVLPSRTLGCGTPRCVLVDNWLLPGMATPVKDLARTPTSTGEAFSLPLAPT